MTSATTRTPLRAFRSAPRVGASPLAPPPPQYRPHLARRLPLLLLAAALIALATFAVRSPAEAQTATWTSTLTVDRFSSGSNTWDGCDEDDATQDNCSTNLSNDDFHVLGVGTYEVRGLLLTTISGVTTLRFRARPASGMFHLPTSFDSRAVLTVDGSSSFAFADATRSAGNLGVVRYDWNSPGIQWSDNQQVSLKLILRPGRPEQPTLTPGNGRLGVSWTTPAGSFSGYGLQYKETSAPDRRSLTGGDPALGWVDHFQRLHGDSFVAHVTGNSAVIRGLKPGTSYDVRVRAQDDNGLTGWDWSPKASAAPVDVSAVPTMQPPTLVATWNTVAVSWEAALSLDSPVTRYRLSYTAVDGAPSLAGLRYRTFDSTTTTTLFTGIPSTALMQFRVQAMNAHGWGPWSGAANTWLDFRKSVAERGIVQRAERPCSRVHALKVTAGSGPTAEFSTLALNHPFWQENTAYRAAVGYNTTHVKLTPTNHDSSSCRLKVRKGSHEEIVASGAASGPIALDEGANQLQVRSFAVTQDQHGTTEGLRQTYTVTVTRAAGATVTLSASPTEVWEGQPVKVTATLSKALSHDVSIPISFGGDRSIRIPAGARSSYSWFKAPRDTDADNEQIAVALGSDLPASVLAGRTTSQRIAVLDPDGFAMTLTADRQPVEGGGKDGGGQVTVTVDLGQPAPAGFYATINSSASTASYSLNLSQASRPDWTMSVRGQLQGGEASDAAQLPGPPGPPARICVGRNMAGDCHTDAPHPDWNNIPWRRIHYLKDWNGASKKTFTIDIADDPFVDPGETIVLQGTGYIFSYGHDHLGRSGFEKGQLQSNQLTLTIQDNDGDGDDEPPLQMGILDTRTRETGKANTDNTARVRVWLSRPAAEEVSVSYGTVDGTATAGSDFTSASGTLKFAAGETRKEITVAIKNDTVEDSGETFVVRLSNPTPSSLVTLVDREATVTILNDEADLEGLWLWGAPAADGPYSALDIGTFAANTTAYAVTVPHETTHAKLAGIAAPEERLKLKAGRAGSTLTAVSSGAKSPAVALAVGDTILEVQATGPLGDRKTYRVTVTREAKQPAKPTVASPIADITSLEAGASQLISLAGVFSDPDGDALTLSAVPSDNAVVTVAARIDPVTASATAITVTGVSSGTATITVTARDSDGNSVSDAFDVTVPAADSPQEVITVPGPVIDLTLMAEGDQVVVNWTAPTIGSAPKGYIVHLKPEGGKTGSGKTKRPKAKKTTVSYSKLEAGTTYNVWVRAQNDAGKGGRVHSTITLNSAPTTATARANSAPTVASEIADLSGLLPDDARQVSLAGVFTDTDRDALTITASSSNDGVAAATVNGQSLTVSARQAGTATITVTAADGRGGSVSDAFSVTVSPKPNNAPTVASALGDLSGLREGDARQVSLAGVFTDADGDALTITASSSNDDIAAATVNGQSLTVTAKQTGTTIITVTAADGRGGSVSDAFTVTVAAAPKPNSAPTVASALGSLSGLREGDTRQISLAGVFTDADGDTLTITASSLNNGVATATVNGQSLTVSAKQAGTTTITVTAADDRGSSVTGAFSVTVEANVAPQPEPEPVPEQVDTPEPEQEQQQDSGSASDSDLPAIVQQYDKDGSGKIESGEWALAIADYSAQKLTTPQIQVIAGYRG